MPTDRERITRLETQNYNLQTDLNEIANDFRQFRNNEFTEFRGEVRRSLSAITERLSKMAGFFGGVAFCFSGLWAIIILAVNWLVKAGNTH